MIPPESVNTCHYPDYMQSLLELSANLSDKVFSRGFSTVTCILSTKNTRYELMFSTPELKCKC